MNPRLPRSARWALLLAACLAAGLGRAAARPLAIGGLIQPSALDTRLLSGTEMIAVWTLPRLGVAVRNDPRDLRLVLGPRELRYGPRGWEAVGFAWRGRLSAPETVSGSLHVPLEALTLLGVPVLADTPSLIDFAVPAAPALASLPPSATAPAPGVPATAPATPRPPVAELPPVLVPTPVPPKPGPTAPVQPTPAQPTPGQPSPVQPSPVQPAPVPPGPPQPPAPPAVNLDTVRVSRTFYRTVEVQRVVLELGGAVAQTVIREAAGLRVELPGVGAQASDQTLPSGDRLSVQPQERGTVVRLGTGGGRSEVFTLNDPYRVVIDTTTYTDSRVPPPVNPDALPDGVTYTRRGTLHLLSFDPARYQPRVVSAPLGRAADVSDLVRGAGGVAGVNGGYFDPASNWPVDLVALGGVMTSGSLEKRATVGFTAQGEALFGYPRPRYVLSGPFGSVMVNSIRARPDAELLTAFVGDGRTAVGADTLTTLLVAPGSASVTRALTGSLIPPAGTLAFTFDPERFPSLPQAAGTPINVTLSWRATDADWPRAQDALSAGPLLVADGKVSLDPAREGFNTAANIWRPTRQVAFGTLSGQPTIAYFEHGTPEAFAAALAGAGLRDAVRLDSGSSATAYLTGGYGGLGGYLNTVWSRPVPNAIVFVPKGAQARK